MTTLRMLLITSLLGASAAAHAQVMTPIWVEDEAEDPDTLAEEEPAELIVQSATKRVESVQESTQIVTVVTHDHIRRSGYRTLNEVLNDIPGFEAFRQKGYWYESVRAYSRGTPRTILILWNGVPLNSPKINERSIGPEISLEGVSRIEVVSGPGGVTWGSNAYLGVVNLVSERPTGEWQESVTVLGGGGDGAAGALLGNASVSGSFLDGDLRFRLGLSYYSAVEAGYILPYDVQTAAFRQPKPDAYYQLTDTLGPTESPREQFLTARLAVEVGKLSLDVSYPLVFENYTTITERAIRADLYHNTSTGETIRNDNNVLRDSWALAMLRYRSDLGDDSHLEARLFYTGFDRVDERIVQAPKADVWSYDRAPGSNDVLKNVEYRYGAAVDVTHDLGRFNLLYGGEAFVEGAHAEVFSVPGVTGDGVGVNAGHRTVLAGFVNGRARLIDSVRLELGGRYQLYPDTDLGNELLGSAALLWTPISNVFIKGGAAMGYRPPTLENVYRNNDPITNTLPSTPTNPDLGSEKSTAAEVEISTLMLQDAPGLRYLRLAAGYQYTVLDDLIADRGGLPENAATRILHTGDLRADLRLKKGIVNLAYSFFYGYDRDTGELRNVANHKVFVGGEFPLTSSLYFTCGLTVYGPREDLNRGVVPSSAMGTFEAPPGDVLVDRLAPVGLLRASLVWEGLWNDRLDLSLHAYNLLDNRFMVPDEDFERRTAIFSVSAPGMSVLAGATLRL